MSAFEENLNSTIMKFTRVLNQKMQVFICLTSLLSCQTNSEVQSNAEKVSKDCDYDITHDKFLSSHFSNLSYQTGKTGFWQIYGHMKPELGYPSDHIIAEGFYKKDLKTGKWVEYDKNQMVKFEGLYYKDTLHGPCKKYVYSENY